MLFQPQTISHLLSQLFVTHLGVAFLILIYFDIFDKQLSDKAKQNEVLEKEKEELDKNVKDLQSRLKEREATLEQQQMQIKKEKVNHFGFR